MSPIVQKNKNTDRTMMEQFVLVSAIGYFPLICLSHWIKMIFLHLWYSLWDSDRLTGTFLIRGYESLRKLKPTKTYSFLNPYGKPCHLRLFKTLFFENEI